MCDSVWTSLFRISLAGLAANRFCLGRLHPSYLEPEPTPKHSVKTTDKVLLETPGNSRV